jgi:hypothetical protein
MRSLRNPLLLVALSFGFAATSAGQQAHTTKVDNEFIQSQFGQTCKLISGPSVYVGDLDGDGVEDVVIPARCTNPLGDQSEKSFKVIDPYNTFNGYGDIKLTTGFASEDPEGRGLSLLVIHGIGPEAWRAAEPKAKFVIINLPYKQLADKKLLLKKKTILAIYAEEAHEAEGEVSVVLWDGKNYRYQSLGSSLE